MEKKEKILNSLDGISRATAKPFLLTRIHARMQKSEVETFTTWDKAIYFLSRPAVIAASIILFVLLNLFAAFGTEDAKAENNIATNTQAGRDYSNMNIASIYDFENQEP